TICTFSPAIKGGGVGLIQFIERWVRPVYGVGAKDLMAMCRMRQLVVVAQYYLQAKLGHANVDYQDLEYLANTTFVPSLMPHPEIEVYGIQAGVGEPRDVPVTRKGQAVVGADGKPVTRKALFVEWKGKEYEATPERLEVYRTNSPVDVNGDGLITRDEYPSKI